MWEGLVKGAYRGAVGDTYLLMPVVVRAQACEATCRTGLCVGGIVPESHRTAACRECSIRVDRSVRAGVNILARGPDMGQKIVLHWLEAGGSDLTGPQVRRWRQNPPLRQPQGRCDTVHVGGRHTTVGRRLPRRTPVTHKGLYLRGSVTAVNASGNTGRSNIKI